jgi:EmrB/QacA subfamily drug resistance transporter
MMATLLAALDQTIVATALPRIAADLDAFDHLSWVVTAYLIAATVTVPLYGKLSDIYGRRRLFLVAISLFLVGSVLCGVAPSLNSLIAFRALQGLGAGGLIPLSQAVIADLFSPRERGRYQGYITSMWATAAVAGPLVGGSLTDLVSWRWIFYVNVPLGALAMLIVVRTLRMPPLAREHRIDYAGAATLSVTLTALLLATVWGGTTYPWGSPPVVGTAAVAVVGLVVFLTIERRAPEPLLPLSVFRIPVVSVAAVATGLIGAVLFAVTIYMPLFVQGVLGTSATTSGAVLIPMQLGWTTATVTAGQLIARTGRYRVFPILGSSFVLLGLLLITRLGVDSSQAAVAACLAVVGLGMGASVQPYLIAAQNAAPPSQIGVVTATLQLFRSTGSSIAVAGLGAIVAGRIGAELSAHLGAAASRVDPASLLQSGAHLPPDLVEGTRAALAASLHTAFLACLPVAVVGVLLALRLRELPLSRHAARDLEDAATPARPASGQQPRDAGSPEPGLAEGD